MNPNLTPKRKTSNRASAFGIRGRISHDSSRFYNSRLSPTLS
jgi:hypothetical protein